MSDPRFLQDGFDKRLSHLIEECGETIAAAGKLQRWGPQSVNPLLPVEQQETNIDWLRREMKDLRQALDRLDQELGTPLRSTAEAGEEADPSYDPMRVGKALLVDAQTALASFKAGDPGKHIQTLIPTPEWKAVAKAARHRGVSLSLMTRIALRQHLTWLDAYIGTASTPPADLAECREVLDDLQQAEAEYRLMHDRHGDDSKAAGRAWDLMRRAGDKARVVLSKLGAK